MIAWELIGVELESNPIESFKITIKSPQAAPYVLIVLIVYFAFRTIIEWHQVDARRRRLLASRIDFGVAHAIAGAALALFAIQTLLKVQVADTSFFNARSLAALGALFIGQSTYTFIFPWGPRRWMPLSFFWLMIGICLVFMSFRKIEMLWYVGGGLVAGFLLNFFLMRKTRRRKSLAGIGASIGL